MPETPMTDAEREQHYLAMLRGDLTRDDAAFLRRISEVGTNVATTNTDGDQLLAIAVKIERHVGR